MKSKELLKKIWDSNLPPIPKDDIKDCFAILGQLTKEYKQGKDIADALNIKPVRLRMLILEIRKRMISKFQNPSGKFFIIANQSGYKLSENSDELITYLHNLKKRHKNISAMIKELELALSNN